MKPPIVLIATISTAAIASPRTMHVFAALPRFGFGNQSGIEIAVDGELFTGHRVERKARGDFGDAPRAVGDHDELDDDENQEDHEADGIVAADDDLPEEIDDVPGVAVQENLPRSRDVEREPEQSDDQQQRGEDRKRERVFSVKAGADDDECRGDVEGEQHVEDFRRHRNDHQQDQRDRCRRDPNRHAARQALNERQRRIGGHLRCHVTRSSFSSA
jgi:hypothetical protein